MKCKGSKPNFKMQRTKDPVTVKLNSGRMAQLIRGRLGEGGKQLDTDLGISH